MYEIKDFLALTTGGTVLGCFITKNFRICSLCEKENCPKEFLEFEKKLEKTEEDKTK